MVRRRRATRKEIIWPFCERSEPRDPRLETVDRLPQPVDIGEELLDLDADGQVAALLGQVLGDVAGESVTGATAEFERVPREAGEIVRWRRRP